jgi:serine/threonine-protein kinase
MTEHIGIYRVERPIGRGGMGEVFLAWDDRLERRVAIKRIRKDAGLSAEQRERFRREARLAARLSHSAVVQIYDLVSGDADDAIVMEYVEGRTLAERLVEGPLEIGEALRLAQEIAQGLAAAHEAGLIHRDLKAANVLVTPAGHAKILDFGLSRPAVRRSDEEPLTRQGFVIGTFYAMSPEQARGEEVDQRSDLFSLGILLYQMLTGQAPFRGADPAETLKKIVQEPPPDARTLRPDMPPEAGSLIGRLLAKDRRDRPGSADEVAAALERLRLGSGLLLPVSDSSVSDLPTSMVPKETVAPISPQKETLPSSLVGLVGRSRRGLWISAAVVAVLIAAVAATVFLARSRPPLRVAVAPVDVVNPGDERLLLAGSGVLNSAIAGLTSLEGIAPIDSTEVSRGGRSPVEMARVAAAGEILTAEIRREGSIARVTLRRLQGSDARVLWTDTFPVPIDARKLPVLANAVAIKIRNAYPDHALRPGVPELDVRDQDYAAFLDIQQRIDAGAMRLEPEVARLETIIRDSPRFLEARLLAAEVCLTLFRSQRTSEPLEHASVLIRQARDLAPGDPRALRLELLIRLAGNQTENAVEILEQLERVLPGDPELLILRSRLADQQGRWEESLTLLEAAAEQAPSWQNLYRLALAEARHGRIAAARLRLETILRQAPNNLWALEALGHLELLYGDLARAEQIYLSCVGAATRRAYNNLGYARFLRGKYQEAAVSYRRALAVEPDYPLTLVSLADALVELGQTQEAEAHYRRALALLTATETWATPGEVMLKAQCLARLGRSREAVDASQAALRRNPDDSDLLYQNALVLSLAGDRSSALNNVLAALEKGYQPRWFTGSPFRWLRDAPEFRPYLEASTSQQGPESAGRPAPRPADP